MGQLNVAKLPELLRRPQYCANIELGGPMFRDKL
jgi:hypothetical protein